MNMKFHWPLNILFMILALGILTLFTMEIITAKQYMWSTLGIIAYGTVIWTMNDKHRKKYRKASRAAE